MLEADGRWMVRIPRWRSAASSLRFEARLLEYLGDQLTVRVPKPILVGTLETPAGWPFLVYAKLAGAPISDLRALQRAERARLARFLQRLFRELEAVPAAKLRRLGVAPGAPRQYARRFERLRRRYDRLGARRLPVALRSQIRTVLQDTLATLRSSSYRPVLLHGDLWPSHVLWDRGARRPTGVIDWEDARLGDPAADLSALDGIGVESLRVLGEMRRQPHDESFWGRLALYRQLLPLGGFLFGLESNNPEITERHRIELEHALEGPTKPRN
jgi:aminoglycoside 2''-phosphotransferase